MLPNLGTTEILVISALLFLMVGGKKLPELSRGIAESIREFKKAARE